MKRIASQFPYLTALAVAAAALFATSPLASARPSHVDRVEARIKEFHAKLNIAQLTPDLGDRTARPPDVEQGAAHDRRRHAEYREAGTSLSHPLRHQ